MARVEVLVTVLIASSFVCCKSQATGGSNVAIGLPHQCADGDMKKCDVTAKVSKSPDSASAVRIELMGVPNGPQNLKYSDRWIAVGFSEDGMMPKSPVVSCFVQNGKPVAKLTWNIAEGYLNIGWAGIDQKPVQLIKSSTEGNGLSCTVDLQKKFTINDVNVDLGGRQYFLIHASGLIVQDTMTAHDVFPESSAPKNFAF